MTKVCGSVWIWAKLNDMAHGKDPEQRLAVIDYEYGEYVAFLAGSIMVKVREIFIFYIVKVIMCVCMYFNLSSNSILQDTLKVR